MHMIIGVYLTSIVIYFTPLSMMGLGMNQSYKQLTQDYLNDFQFCYDFHENATTNSTYILNN